MCNDVNLDLRLASVYPTSEKILLQLILKGATHHMILIGKVWT